MEKNSFNLNLMNISVSSDLIPKSVHGKFAFHDIVALEDGEQIPLDENSIVKIFDEVLKDSSSKSQKGFELKNFLENLKNILESNPKILDSKKEKKILVEGEILSQFFSGILNPKEIKLTPIEGKDTIKLELVSDKDKVSQNAGYAAKALNKFPSEMKIQSPSSEQEFLITIEPEDVEPPSGKSVAKEAKTVNNTKVKNVLENFGATGLDKEILTKGQLKEALTPNKKVHESTVPDKTEKEVVKFKISQERAGAEVPKGQVTVTDLPALNKTEQKEKVPKLKTEIKTDVNVTDNSHEINKSKKNDLTVKIGEKIHEEEIIPAKELKVTKHPDLKAKSEKILKKTDNVKGKLQSGGKTHQNADLIDFQNKEIGELSNPKSSTLTKAKTVKTEPLNVKKQNTKVKINENGETDSPIKEIAVKSESETKVKVPDLVKIEEGPELIDFTNKENVKVSNRKNAGLTKSKAIKTEMPNAKVKINVNQRADLPAKELTVKSEPETKANEKTDFKQMPIDNRQINVVKAKPTKDNLIDAFKNVQNLNTIKEAVPNEQPQKIIYKISITPVKEANTFLFQNHSIKKIKEKKLEAKKEVTPPQQKITDQTEGSKHKQVTTKPQLNKNVVTEEIHHQNTDTKKPDNSHKEFVKFENETSTAEIKTHVPKAAPKFSNHFASNNAVNFNSLNNGLKQTQPVQHQNLANELKDGFFKNIDFSSTISEISKFIIKGDKHTAVLKLHPRELGEIKINVEVVKNAISAHVEVQNENVKQLIQANLQVLRENLAQQGLALNNFNINYSHSRKEEYSHKKSKRRVIVKNNSADEEIGEVEQYRFKNLGYNQYDFIA